MRCTKFKATLVVFLALAITCHGTTCGDASDGSVPNCCDADEGTCTSCAVNYGLSKDKSQCVKCKDPKCSDCPGNPSVCKSVIKPPIPNCSYAADDNSVCFDCSDGYSLAAGGTKCIVCGGNCMQCSSPNVCKTCNPGYGNPKKCSKCKDPKCYTCAPNLTTCSKCNAGYGVNGGKCTKCGISIDSCDNGKPVCSQGTGTFGNNGACRKCSVSYCAACNKSACDQCLSGFGTFGNNGACKLCSVTSCMTCDESACDQCFTGYSFTNGQCTKAG